MHRPRRSAWMGSAESRRFDRRGIDGVSLRSEGCERNDYLIRGTIHRHSARGRRLAVQVVAYIGIAVSGIIPQAPVELKRLIELIDPLARVIDWRWVVRRDSGRLHRQGGRSWKTSHRGNRRNEGGAPSRDVDAAFCLFACITPILNSSFRPLQTLHD